MNERIKELRIVLNLTQEDFGKRIGVQRAAVNKWEKGINGVADSMILSICREFGVSEQWLRTGEGEMFEQTRETVLDKLCTEYGLGREQRAVVEGFLDLTPQERDIVLKYLHNVFDHTAAPVPPLRTVVPDEELERISESDEYKSLVEKNGQAVEKVFSTVG